MQEKSRNKILIISENSPHLDNFIKLIVDDKFDIKVITSSGKYLSEDIKSDFTNFSFLKLKNYFQTISLIKSNIRNFKPDLIYIHQASSVAFFSHLANRKFKIKTILTAWGSDVLVMPKRNLLFKKISQFVLRSSDVLTSDSVFMAEEMKRLILPLKKEIYIYNFGVEIKDLEIKKEKFIYSNRNHNPIYRIDKVIHAFQKFAQKEVNSDWKLLIAGQGSETDTLKKMVEDFKLQDKVSFVGFVNQDENFRNYAKSSYFVSIPESDATAISLLEAMYFKCIPILIDLPANREWVSDGENGFIIEDVTSDFFEKVLSNSKIMDVEKSRELIIKKASKEVCSNNFKSLILKTISQ
ncbi:MAG: glycosyltransferase [Bacteroidota bacterium]